MAIVGVFLGLVAGQAIHTVADNIEKSLYWVGRRIMNVYYTRSAERPDAKGGTDDQSTLERWLTRRYWGIHDVLKSHRRLFQNRLEWYFYTSSNKRNSEVHDVVNARFQDACREMFSIDVARPEASQPHKFSPTGKEFYDQLYPLVVSAVESGDNSRALTFQSRYSFCRGMWVSLLLLAVLYLGLIPFGARLEAVIGGSPLLLQVLDTDQIVVTTGIILGFMFVFMDASGTYKKHYVEYLIAEFYLLSERKPNEEAETETEEGEVSESNPGYY